VALIIHRAVDLAAALLDDAFEPPLPKWPVPGSDVETISDAENGPSASCSARWNPQRTQRVRLRFPLTCGLA